MKKIALVSLILCLCVCLLTGCTSLSTYLDRLDNVNAEYGIYVEEDFNKDDILLEYELDADEFGFIEGERVSNKKQGTSAVIMAFLSESGAEEFVGAVSGKVEALNADSSQPVKAMNDGRFVLIGHEPALADLLGE